MHNLPFYPLAHRILCEILEQTQQVLSYVLAGEALSLLLGLLHEHGPRRVVKGKRTVLHPTEHIYYLVDHQCALSADARVHVYNYLVYFSLVLYHAILNHLSDHLLKILNSL